MTLEDEEDLDLPFGVTPGNIVFGGLPKYCGPERAIQHLERVAALGGEVAERKPFVERMKEEQATELQSQHDIGERIVEALANHTFSSASSRYAFPFSRGLPGRLIDDSLELGLEYGLVASVDRDMAIAALRLFLLAPPGRSVADLLDALEEYERDRWELPMRWPDPLRERALTISPSALVLGLHELARLPWAHTGGLVSGRGATDEYLKALQNLDRDVLKAYVLHDWHFEQSRQAESLAAGIDDLIELSIPFQMSLQVKAILDQLSHQFLLGQYAVVVILARSAIEAAVKRVMSVSKSAADGWELNKQLVHLEKTGILTKKFVRAAGDVRARGNKAIHHDLSMFDHRELALESIKLLVSALIELRPYLDENPTPLGL